jgi:hypothetical protein
LKGAGTSAQLGFVFLDTVIEHYGEKEANQNGGGEVDKCIKVKHEKIESVTSSSGD